MWTLFPLVKFQAAVSMARTITDEGICQILKMVDINGENYTKIILVLSKNKENLFRPKRGKGLRWLSYMDMGLSRIFLKATLKLGHHSSYLQWDGSPATSAS